MQQLDSLTLKHLAAELNEMLAGSKINKIQHLTGPEFLLGFWGARMDRRQRLYINVGPEIPCCFLSSAEEVETFVVPTLEKPTGLCMLLRKHLNSAQVISVKTLPGERVLNITLENFNELGNRIRLILSLELIGKYSNMLLIDDLPNVILGAAHSVSEAMSRKREIAFGLPYVAPPVPEGKQLLFLATVDDLKRTLANLDINHVEFLLKTLQATYWGMAPSMLLSLLKQAQTACLDKEKDYFYDDLYRLIDQAEAGQDLHPYISYDHQQFGLFPDVEAETDNRLEYPSVQTMMVHYVTHHLTQKRVTERKQRFKQALNRQKKRLAKRQADQKPVASSEIDRLNHYGNLILSGVSSKALSGTATEESITMTDYLTQMPIQISVKPRLSWVDNAQLYFKQAKKERIRQQRYQAVETKITQENDYLDSLLCHVDQAETLADLLTLRDDLLLAKVLKEKRTLSRKSKDKKPKKPALSGILERMSSDGMKIRVGKSGQANAELVGRLSKPEDLWLHVHERPGSHVLVQTEKQPVSDQTLLEAASLAVYFSSARLDKNVPVIYTPVRYIKKIPDSYPGHVNYREEKTVFITPDPALIARFLNETLPASS